MLIPDFFSAEEEIQRLRSAEILLARGRRKRLPAGSPGAWLFERFGVKRQRDWPVAPYTLLADGGSPEQGCWMRADPVHLRVGRDSLGLSDDAAIDVSRAEADALVETLNRHFGETLRFHPVTPARWYVRLPRTPDMQTTPPSAVRLEVSKGNLPSGPDAMRFHALINEAQMLMHEHPVNAEREARGAPELNSVWFWGGGVIGPVAPSSISAVVSDDPLARGLALAAGLPARTLPRDARAMLAGEHGEGVTLVVLDAPRGDSAVSGLRERRESIERDWFEPLLGGLRSGGVGMLTLSLAGADALLESETVRSDLRRFWRLRKPLASYAA